MLILTRVIAYTLLPLLLATGHILLEKKANSKARRVEVYLLYVLAITVGANGIGGFFGHFFLGDMVAELVGWPAGNPFQLEMAFANLVLGALGILAISQRDGFRTATLVAVAVQRIGATVVHFMDIAETGNLAPGNTVQNIGNIAAPLLLGYLLWLAHRTKDEDVTAPAFARWHGRQEPIAAMVAAGIGTGFGVGFAVDLPLLLTLVGALTGVGAGLLLRMRVAQKQEWMAVDA